MKKSKHPTDTNTIPLPILGFSGWSSSGKTTLIEKLIPILWEKGIRSAVIKHDVHGISEDETGKDSFRFIQAGAAACILCGPGGPSLSEAIETVTNSKKADLILVEGFKSAPIPHIGLALTVNGKELPEPADRYLAVITDLPPSNCPVPCYHPNDICGVIAFILSYVEGILKKH